MSMRDYPTIQLDTKKRNNTFIAVLHLIITVESSIKGIIHTLKLCDSVCTCASSIYATSVHDQLQVKGVFHIHFRV
jgi:hypothetical protein